MAPEVGLLWAKTGRGAAGEWLYHPLVCHLLDVAAVTEALLATPQGEVVRERLAAGMGLGEASVRIWVPFLAGLHDLGKASAPGSLLMRSDDLL